MEDNLYMKEALCLAQQSMDEGEVPVGAVVVKDGQIIATGRNRRETGKSALLHAELEAIHTACTVLGGWRLHQCELFVTLEPCPMCAGAIINARLKKVTFGAYDQKAGSLGSIINLFSLPYNHQPELVGGCMEQECSAILSDFFKELREGKKDEKKIRGSSFATHAGTNYLCSLQRTKK